MTRRQQRADSGSSVLVFFIAVNIDWAHFRQFSIVYEKGGFGASHPNDERNPNILTLFLLKYFDGNFLRMSLSAAFLLC